MFLRLVTPNHRLAMEGLNQNVCYFHGIKMLVFTARLFTSE